MKYCQNEPVWQNFQKNEKSCTFNTSNWNITPKIYWRNPTIHMHYETIYFLKFKMKAMSVKHLKSRKNRSITEKRAQVLVATEEWSLNILYIQLPEVDSSTFLTTKIHDSAPKTTSIILQTANISKTFRLQDKISTLLTSKDGNFINQETPKIERRTRVHKMKTY